MVKKIGNFGKAFGILGNLLAIPDTLNAAKHVADKAAPIIEKELDRRHAHKVSLITLDDVTDVSLDVAKPLLEQKGFQVVPILSKPHPKFSQEHPMDIVTMHPKPGKYQSSQMVKLYYVTEEVITASKRLKENKTRQQLKDNLINNLPLLKKK